ncbi:hypothetical protein [Pimelobacter simplex]|nr:hypothetical protein [Pimelobacter simplex]
MQETPPDHRGGYTLVRAARNATAHIISQGVDDGQESMPWDRP